MSLTIAQGTFATSGSTGAQVVSHSLGVTPTGFYFYGNGHMSASGSMNFRQGFDDLTHRRSVGYCAGDAIGVMQADSGGSDAYSLVLVRNSAFGQVSATGYVSAATSTTFTVQWDTAGSVTGQVWRYVLFAGVSVDVGSISPPSAPGNTTKTFSLSAPRALLAFWVPFDSGTSAGGSLQSLGLGMATACGLRQVVSIGYDTDLADPTTNITHQLSDVVFLATSLSATTRHGAITAWHTDSIDITWTAAASVGYFAYLVLGGTLAANLITITEPAATGVQRYPYTIADPQAVIAMSDNKVTSGSRTSNLLFSLGSATADLTQGVVWCGDTNGQAAPAWAVELEGNTTRVLESVIPTSNSTATATSRAALLDLSQGSMGVNWDIADGTAREWFALILGADTDSLPCGGSSPPVLTTYATRRERVWTLPFDMNVEVFLSRLEIFVQSGVGLNDGQGVDPVLMFSLSRDGGHTFGNEIQMGVGKMGEYQRRAFVTRLGRGRNLVAKVACSDPVFFALLANYVDVEMGTS